MGKYYTTVELATILKVDTETIRRYLQTGKIKGFKMGKEWRIAEEDFIQYKKDNSNI